MPRVVFISYLADRAEALRIRDRLANLLGGSNVVSIDDIPPGADFQHWVAGQIRRSDVLLVVIGRNGDRTGADAEIGFAFEQGTRLCPSLSAAPPCRRLASSAGRRGSLQTCRRSKFRTTVSTTISNGSPWSSTLFPALRQRADFGARQAARGLWPPTRWRRPRGPCAGRRAGLPATVFPTCLWKNLSARGLGRSGRTRISTPSSNPTDRSRAQLTSTRRCAKRPSPGRNPRTGPPRTPRATRPSPKPGRARVRSGSGRGRQLQSPLIPPPPRRPRPLERTGRRTRIAMRMKTGRGPRGSRFPYLPGLGLALVAAVGLGFALRHGFGAMFDWIAAPIFHGALPPPPATEERDGARDGTRRRHSLRPASRRARPTLPRADFYRQDGRGQREVQDAGDGRRPRDGQTRDRNA